MRKFGSDLSNKKKQNTRRNSKNPQQVKRKKAGKREVDRPMAINDLKINIELNTDQSGTRQMLFKWLIAFCRPSLELQDVTVEHSFRLYDTFCAECCCARTNSQFEEAQLDVLTCLFISAKYEEIYPPSTSDFEFVSKYLFSSDQILSRELFILKKIDYNLMISTVSYWYFELFGQSPPSWYILTYIFCPPKVSMKCVAQAIKAEIKKNQKRGLPKQGDLESGCLEDVLQNIRKSVQ